MSFAKGQKVRFHPIIGGKHDGNVYTVRSGPHDLHGLASYRIDGKSGLVDERALSAYVPVGGVKA